MRIIRSIALLLLFLYLPCCGNNDTHPSRYLLPAGYVGPIRVEYEVSDAASLPMEEGRYLIRIAADGRAQTSTPLPEGWHSADDFYYVSGTNRQRLPVEYEPSPVETSPSAPSVRGGAVEVVPDKPVVERWFIGTDQQFDNYVKKHGNW